LQEPEQGVGIDQYFHEKLLVSVEILEWRGKIVGNMFNQVFSLPNRA
tara:strand:+ start:540 stop:680 length:141 start_codon:yes stop_codon:yes gene_type:complete